jgi:HD superfamily phosphohydrolase
LDIGVDRPRPQPDDGGSSVEPRSPGGLYRDRRLKTFTIPVSQSVILYGPEIDVVSTREFQRLAGIKQLGTANLVYRGANHTRFEHSLGTVHRTDQIVRAINENPRGQVIVDAAGWRLARLTALLHDLPHIPYGHTLEDEFGLLERHDKNQRRINALLTESRIGELLRAGLGDDESGSEREWLELVDILSGQVPTEKLDHPYVRDIVGNTVCADALDYIERDLAACGMAGTVGTRFLDFFTIVSDSAPRESDRLRTALRLDKRGMPRPDVESEVVKLLSYRYELAERVYFHHAKNSASVMVGRAVVDSGLLPHGDPAIDGDPPEVYDKNFRWLSDELLLHSIRSRTIADALELHREDRSDDELDLASRLADAVLNRDLYKIAYMATREDLANSVDRIWSQYRLAALRRQLEDSFAQMAALSPGEVLVHLPDPKGLTKLADVRVQTDQDEILSLEQWDKTHSGRLRPSTLPTLVSGE